MKTSLKVYLASIYILFLLALFFAWEGFNLDQFIITTALTILIILFNIDMIKDLQDNGHYFIFRPFTIPAIVYIEPFYSILLLSIILLFKLYQQVWYKIIYNVASLSFSIFLSSYFFHYFYPTVEEGVIFTAQFLLILLAAIFINLLIDSLFVIIPASLEKGKFNEDTFISIITTVKTSLITLFLGLINVILYFYTNLIGVAIFTFLVYFIKPALQYREIFDNELSTYTNFVLHMMKQLDPITHSHSERVKFWTVLLAKKMGLSSSDIRQLSQAASWHDIGKVEIPDNILNKDGKLTPEEYEIIKEHPEKGYNLVKDMHFFKKFLSVIRYHHERYDGKGYPLGLKAEEIPLHARIMAITDAFDAMTSDRSYRPGMTIFEAVNELIENSGTQFDPMLVNVFVEALREDYGDAFEKYDKSILMNVG